MAVKVIMPKQGLQMTEGTILKWLTAEGQTVEAGRPLFEMETDKLTIEIDAPGSGKLLKIVRGEGEVVPITETIAIIGNDGEDISALLPGAENAGTPVSGANAAAEAGTEAGMATDVVAGAVAGAVNGMVSSMVTGTGTGMRTGRIFITPRARMRAQEKSIDIADVKGTGPDGLIIERDITGASAVPALSANAVQEAVLPFPALASAEGRLMPFAGMRKSISVNMMRSIHGMAQANHRMKVDMSETVRLRDKFKAEKTNVSYTDILIKVVSKVLKEYPEMNSSLTDKGIFLHEHANIGIAVAVENGLIVPVVRNADKKTLAGISAESAGLIDKAKKGALNREDYTGGTFTITNLGMFDIDEFTAIINPPEAGILAVGKIADTPSAEDGKVVIKPVMTLSLTYDHRIIDGAPAARFLQRIKQILQNPYLLA